MGLLAGSYIYFSLCMCVNHHEADFGILSSGFIVCPTSQIVPLDSAATFHCVVIGNELNTVLQWLIDGLLDSSTPIVGRGINAITDVDLVTGTVNSTLMIPATLMNNMTSITCRVIALDVLSVDESPEVTLLIQGINRHVQ